MKCLAAINLLDGEHVSDMLLRQTGPRTLRHGCQKRTAFEAKQCVQIELQIEPEVVGVRRALVFAAGNVAGNISDEGQCWSDAQSFHFRAVAPPIVEQMLAR